MLYNLLINIADVTGDNNLSMTLIKDISLQDNDSSRNGLLKKVIQRAQKDLMMYEQLEQENTKLFPQNKHKKLEAINK